MVETVHANCLRLGNKGIILLGQSGSGKSVLTLSLIERAQWAQKDSCLISDDYTDLKNKNGRLYGSCPENLRGAIEIRGAGLYEILYDEEVAIDFIIALCEDYERYPTGKKTTYCGVSLPFYALPSLKLADSTSICQAIEALCFKNLWKNASIIE